MANQIAVLAGDGIGPEVMQVSLEILQKALGAESKKYNFSEALVGGAAIDSAGEPLPKETLHLCEKSDAILFGSVGGPKWENLPPQNQPERGALLPLRKHFKLFANLRPVKLYPELIASSPLKEERIKDGVDMLIVRELTGGIYFGQPKGREGDGENEKGFDTMVYHRFEIERIAKLAFESAVQRGGRVTSIDKANVLTTMVLWRDVVTEFAAEFNNKSSRNIELDHLYVDNAAMQIILNPSRFDVVLCGNMFGDIISDEASVIGGSLGMLASASLSSNEGFGLYEPSGGTAPDIAGKGIANPVAQVLSSALMMRYSFNRDDIATKIENSVQKAIGAGARTADIVQAGETSISTKEIAEEIMRNLV